MRPQPITGHLRGGLVGALVGVLAVAAHGAAGGGFPGSAELTLVLLIAAAAGSTAGAVSARRNPVAVVGLLGAGQLASHAALSGLLGHNHAGTTESALPTCWMLVAHAIATLGCAALIVLAEALYTVASAALCTMLASPRARIVGTPHWSDPGLPAYRFHPNGSIGPRAPPVSV
ncbi:hypothetical protein OH799_24690 [Nocardia sp. NBC_00881]|uniref:hypothetical protein n=1 Tax=Nocardia sp. NBC_00881 TaxID=2975995 RepID=UPI0038708E6E|nr:hypothetical protein OH799_24690 [Nocardia sp. NBC_00881]